MKIDTLKEKIRKANRYTIFGEGVLAVNTKNLVSSASYKRQGDALDKIKPNQEEIK